ncbi:hypothetical protein K438DRAFT_1856313 [Mycena galopus ATCC 62051]|nr:hypothetical protein K438DRAFT_1856313 [Mycena galopus ATCC 62051]
MAILPGTKESYIGALLENIIYGAYLSGFFECCAVFSKSQTRSTRHTYLLVTTGLMFIFITMRCIIDTYRCIAAFDDPNLNFGPPNSPLGILTNSCCMMVFILADIFIIFRTFIVWNKRWIFIVLPSILCLADFILGIVAIVALSESGRSNAVVWTSVNWLIYVFAFTVSINVVCTGLISFRILAMHRRVARMVVNGRTATLKIVSVIVESAAIYTAILLVTIAVVQTQNFAFFVVIDCLPPTIGLVFSHIIIRVSRGTSFGETTVNLNTTTTSQQYSSNHHDFRPGESIITRSGGKTEVHIRLEQITQGSAAVKAGESPPNSEDMDVANYAA